MALLYHNGECEIQMAKNKVFDALCLAIPAIKGMKIDSSDKLLGRIVAKAGVSLFSWGESISIQVIEIQRTERRFRSHHRLKPV